jgi:hypothetical protein
MNKSVMSPAHSTIRIPQGMHESILMAVVQSNDFGTRRLASTVSSALRKVSKEGDHQWRSHTEMADGVETSEDSDNVSDPNYSAKARTPSCVGEKREIRAHGTSAYTDCQNNDQKQESNDVDYQSQRFWHIHMLSPCDVDNARDHLYTHSRSECVFDVIFASMDENDCGDVQSKEPRCGHKVRQPSEGQKTAAKEAEKMSISRRRQRCNPVILTARGRIPRFLRSTTWEAPYGIERTFLSSPPDLCTPKP